MKIFFTLLVSFSAFSVLQAQQYVPAADKSTVKFSIKNFGIRTGGEFNGVAGQIEFNKTSPEKAVVDVHVDAASVNTGNDSRDSHLREAEYFNVEKYPTIQFRSEKITSKGNGFSVTGKLIIKGTEKNISFPFTATAQNDGLLFEGSFEINRRDFKVGGNSAVLGDNVTVTLSVLAKKK